MTTAHDWTHPPPGGWSVDDLDSLPEDGFRRELIDGVLHVSPTPTRTHQKVALYLGYELDAICPPEYDVTQSVEIRITPQNSLVPDVLVTTAEAAARNPSKYHPHEVVLAIEIVSPGSRATDRATKPHLYARAGIPYYWRIELEPTVEIHTYWLEPVERVYAPGDVFTEQISLDEPWRIELPVARLTPRTP